MADKMDQQRSAFIYAVFSQEEMFFKKVNNLERDAKKRQEKRDTKKIRTPPKKNPNQTNKQT